MFSFIKSFLPSSNFLTVGLIPNPVDSFLQGLIGTCGISVLASLMRVHLFIVEHSHDESEENEDNDGLRGGKRKRTPKERWTTRGLGETLQFFVVAFLLSVVGSQVASLVVLEFCLRAVSGLITSGHDLNTHLHQLLVQSQFSLGCALSCSLHFLHEGAPQCWLCLLLAAALSWYLARQATRLLHHTTALYKLHSTKRYCGVCISLLTWGHDLLPALCRLLIITFSVAVVASVSIINQHFLSAAEALRFWTPLTICYTLLVVYMQDAQNREPRGQALFNTVAVRLGGLMILMLTMGRWADVLHILVCFMGEVACLIHTMDLLDDNASS